MHTNWLYVLLGTECQAHPHTQPQQSLFSSLNTLPLPTCGSWPLLLLCSGACHQECPMVASPHQEISPTILLEALSPTPLL